NQTELRTLVLNKARISDTISDWFWQLSLTLDELDVAYNELRGRVPNSLGFNFPAKVDLSFNNFEGRLLLWSFNVTKLYLRDNSFSGLIPNDIGQNLPFLTDLGNLKQLITLVISNNNLSGEIPLLFSNISFLYILDMSNNSLSGSTPESIGSLRTVKFLVLRNNYLSGKLPLSLKNCTFQES
ncbi:hypothetical protein CISIN_1g0373252mg, partial [Citrus sinensis]